jgi:hypothetical protein
VRPIGLWSTLITLSKWSSPSIDLRRLLRAVVEVTRDGVVACR